MNFFLENACHHLLLVPSEELKARSTSRDDNSSLACLKYARNKSPSALFTGAGKSPPSGNPGSPGIANCFVDKAFRSRKAAFLSSIRSNFTRHWTACRVRYIIVLSAPPFTSKFRKRTFARKYINVSSIISSTSARLIQRKISTLYDATKFYIQCNGFQTFFAWLSRSFDSCLKGAQGARACFWIFFFVLFAVICGLRIFHGNHI